MQCCRAFDPEAWKAAFARDPTQVQARLGDILWLPTQWDTVHPSFEWHNTFGYEDYILFVGLYAEAADRLFDNRVVVVPASTFYTQNVVVPSRRDRCVRVTVDPAVAEETEFATVSDVLVRAAVAQDRALDDPPPEVVFSKLTAGALILQPIAWTDRIDRVPLAQGHLVNRVWKALKEAEIALG